PSPTPSYTLIDNVDNECGGRSAIQSERESVRLHALVIDADANDGRSLSDILSALDWSVDVAASMAEAAITISPGHYSLIFLDAQAESDDSYGVISQLSELKIRCGEATPVVITRRSSQSDFVLKVMMNGAFDSLRKPCEEMKVREIALAVRERLRAAAREARDESEFAVTAVGEGSKPNVVHELVGESDVMTCVVKELARIINHINREYPLSGLNQTTARQPPAFFITGETGTGKELIAGMIHRHSPHSHKKLVAINCGSLPTELVESVLFGHVAGAFTGATKDKMGLWELADGGTLFLDEITEATPVIQAKLLRVLQNGEVQRLGSQHTVKTRVQVVAASNRVIETEIRAGRFRQDLYYRLNQHCLHLPPLRDRLEDVPGIVKHFLHLHFNRRVSFSKEAMEMLMSYSFPGNVRELENIVRGAARQSPDGTVYGVDLPSYVEPAKSNAARVHAIDDKQQKNRETSLEGTHELHDNGESGLDERVRRFTRHVVHDALADCGGSRRRAAEQLKITRQRLYKLLNDAKHAAS
ncbi:MAG: sigma-54 dependent transcriptional regulator, partial [Acidobacteriota bacterium]|nr:sigma-54 dependent transcriptional regulator [Acidobacteriota bacterium]